MKTKLKPLLTLFIFLAPFALWGQSEDFLKFEPLELLDTLHQLPSSEENQDFYDDYDLLLSDEGIFLLKKNKNYWERFIVGTFSWSYTLDSMFFSSDKKFMMLQVTLYYTRDVTNFFLIDLSQMALVEIEMQYGGINKEEDSLGIQTSSIYEFNSNISFDGVSLFINTDIYNIIEIYDFNGEQSVISRDTTLGYNFYDGEYHYINGNFVKIKPYINKHHFAHSVFDMGEKISLTPECTFYFECDCCFEHLLFTSDSTFIVVAPCTYNVSVSFGKYEVIDNQLYLHFSGKWTERYMASDEQDTGTEYAYRDTLLPAHTEIFSPDICKNTTLFTEQNNTNIKLLRTQKSVEEQLEYLIKFGLLDKLRK